MRAFFFEDVSTSSASGLGFALFWLSAVDFVDEIDLSVFFAGDSTSSDPAFHKN